MKGGEAALRRAARVDVRIPAVVQVQGPLSGSLSSPMSTNYEAVPVPDEMQGAELEGTIVNLSLNGAFVAVAGQVPPLLGRLAVRFELEGFGPVLAHCIVMWRSVVGALAADYLSSSSASGVGVLFEAIPIEARQAIADVVRKRSATRYQALVVEDSDVMRRLIVDSLRRLEVQEVVAVAEARNGAEALKVLDARKLDIIVSDIYMPEMDGFKLISCVRSHPLQKGTPILVITSDNDPADAERAMELGANAILMKPLQKSQICEAVRGLLGMS